MPKPLQRPDAAPLDHRHKPAEVLDEFGPELPTLATLMLN